jgi:hypothetical protein
MHSVVTEVKNRNGACVMEDTSLGLPCDDENEGRGKIRKSRLERSEAKAYLRFVSLS